MYTTVRRYEGVTDTNEVVRRINEGFVSLIRDVSGFVNYSVVDAGGGTLVTISVFEDSSGAEESNSRSWEWIQQEGDLASLIPNRPQITAGEVVTHEGA
jgi:hypothetical protein